FVRPRFVVVEPPVGHAGLCNSSIGRALRPAYPMFGTNRRPPGSSTRGTTWSVLYREGCGLPIAKRERPRCHLRAENPSEMTPVRPTFYLAGVGRSSEAAPQTGIV